MKRLLILSLLLSFSCISPGNGDKFVRGLYVEEPTLAVWNTSIETIIIYGPNGIRLGTVLSGQTECLKFFSPQAEGPIQVRVLGGKTYRTNFPLSLSESRYWSVEIRNNVPTSLLTLQPSDRCTK